MNHERLSGLIRDRLVLMKAATVILWSTWIISIALSGFTKDIEGKPIGTDHLAFYTAAKLIDEGRGDRIYDVAFTADYQTALCHTPISDPYRNPPFYALIYIPTSRLSYLASFWIWTTISVVALWFGLGWLNAEKRFTAFLFAMSFYPVFATFSFGQNSLLSFGLFCLSFRALERGKPLFAGITAGLLLYKPQLLLGLCLWWLFDFRHYWKCFVGLALTGLFCLAVSLLAVPVATRIFIQQLPEIARYDAFWFWNLHNPRGFGTLISGDDKRFGNLVGLVCSLIAIACFVFFWRRQRKNVPIMFAAAIFLTLWASPHTMIYEWTLALIPAVLLWDRIPEKRSEWLLIFAISWIVLFVSTPLSMGMCRWTKTGVHDPGWAIQVSVPVMAVVAIWAMRALRTSKRLISTETPASGVA